MANVATNTTLNSVTAADLHSSLYARFRKYNLPLDALHAQASAAGRCAAGAEIAAYRRPAAEAGAVERLMGRDNARVLGDCHPVIELRVDADFIVLELVMAPAAWIDQENLLGKLNVERQRREFCKLIGHLHPAMRLGFWQGGHLDDMHLTADKLARANVFEHWMATYTDRQDTFRAGMWYTRAEAAAMGDNFAVELFNRAQELYSLYTFIAWTGNNDFRGFYQRGAVGMSA